MPGGTGRSASSSTYPVVPAIGLPIGGRSAPASARLIVAHTVLSVGPYALIIRRPGAQRSAVEPVTVSPTTTSVVTDGSSVSFMTDSAEGGTVKWVVPVRAANLTSSGPGVSCSAGATTKVAPANRLIATSAMGESKFVDANCSTWDRVSTFSGSTCDKTRFARP